MRTTSVLVVVLLCAPAIAVAQGENKAAAAAAFERGKDLRDAGKMAEACAEFQRSQELDPQFGTQYNLALCYESTGRLASAFGLFDELAAKDANTRRRADAQKRRAALEPRLTRLSLVARERAPGLIVHRGDLDVTLMVGVTAPVDPGVYVFRAEAPGRVSWEGKADLTAEGKTITVEVPPLAEADTTGPAEPARTEPERMQTQPPRESAPAVEEHTSDGRGRRILGLSIAGAGGVATVVGFYFGLQARSSNGDAKDACGGDIDPCVGDIERADELVADARDQANLSNLFVGIGVAAIATGVVLWVTAPSDRAEGTALIPVVGAHEAGVALGGRF